MRPPQITGFLSTGVDEHGSKISRTASNLRFTPKQLCDQVSLQFRDLCKSLHVDASAFMRTTSERHMLTVQDVWRTLDKSDHLYWSAYSGWYSTTDEAFYSDWEVDTSPLGAVSKTSGNQVHWVEEETFRFRLSAFKPKLHVWLDSGVLPNESPEHAGLLALTHKTLDRLEDPCVSRPSSRVPWGIPVPGRIDQTIYVWFDALMNYLTAGGVSFTADGNSQALWPPDIHFVGKDILCFHAILWPAILMALDLPLPKKIIPHGHILVGGTKMSKSLGNVLSPADVLGDLSRALSVSPVHGEVDAESVASDCLRYCLVRSVCLNEDTTFSLPFAKETVNTELVNWLGNLLSRITSKKIAPNQTAPMLDLAEAQQFLSAPADAKFFNDLSQLPFVFDDFWWDRLLPNRSVDAVMHVVRQTNAFVDRHKPWAAGGDGDAQAVVGVALEALRLVGCCLSPLTPYLSNRLLNCLGLHPGKLRGHSWRLDLTHQPLIPRLNV
uniref:Methionine--tRNA ligase, mitochondrial n=1 Tax=Mesocestoides corti TaxID=53468 RepID=A0A5K3EK28_MESCO